MDASVSLKDDLFQLYARNEQLRARYKHGISSMSSQGAIRMVHSMLDQMRQHEHILAALHGAGLQPVADPAPDNDAIDDREFLETIKAEETSFADVIKGVAEKEGLAPDLRQSLKGLAESRHKFASWANDHIDLIDLFGA